MGAELEPIAVRNLHVRVDTAGVFCDQGYHLGMWRVDMRLSVYLTDEQWRLWAEHGFTIAPKGAPDADPDRPA
jgi:hypothetical protein